ncbi:class I SAM-dependent RNA methyltransferase [uncultured Jatrophihabitans sp.]|uniref:class I SAM-dependent RNA methyltransferase n=1 Tax=uncultured Jatrophihabitans sp. TaxID=1610747 RepID=UPI0035C9592B
MAERGPLAGATLELDIGGPAHGGSCVARHEGRAVFVRHALPGERVRALVTEDRGGSYCFADAVEVLTASPDRVEPPCPHAGPGRCGGCDWQHASAQAQRVLKETVIREQFTRLARFELGDLLAGVEALPGGLLGWRSRILWALDDRPGTDGGHGLRRHRSHTVEQLDHCPLAQPAIAAFPSTGELTPRATGLEQVAGDGDETTLLVHTPGGGRQARGRRPPDRVRVVRGPEVLHHEVDGRSFGVQAGGFWQVHPAAAATFVDALLAAVAPGPGERVLDLYAGAGLLTAALADAVGPLGAVLGVESSAAAVGDAEANLAHLPQARVQRARVTAESLVAPDGPLDPAAERFDVVVLDPPRAGAGREVMQALLDHAPRAIGYVACDPAALARDVAVARSAGWRLTSVRAFDAFPMTHHVECVARLEPPAANPGP